MNRKLKRDAGTSALLLLETRASVVIRSHVIVLLVSFYLWVLYGSLSAGLINSLKNIQLNLVEIWCTDFPAGDSELARGVVCFSVVRCIHALVERFGMQGFFVVL